jgi:hypothetical protein
MTSGIMQQFPVKMNESCQAADELNEGTSVSSFTGVDTFRLRRSPEVGDRQRR